MTGKVLAFARVTLLRFLPATVVVQSEWLTPTDMEVLQAAEIVALL